MSAIDSACVRGDELGEQLQRRQVFTKDLSRVEHLCMLKLESFYSLSDV